MQHFFSNPPHGSHRGSHDSRTRTYTGDSDFFQFCHRRACCVRKNIYRGLHCLHQLGDGFPVVNARCKQAIGPSVAVCPQPFNSSLEPRGLRTDGHQINIRARIQHERNTDGFRRLADGANLFHLQRQSHMRTLVIAGHVFEVHPDSAGIDGCFCRFRHVLHRGAVARFQIRCYRHSHGPGNSPHHIQHLVPRDTLTVRITPGKSDRRAACCDCWMPAFFQNPRAHHIPSVREHQHSRPVMKLSELFSFFGLYAHIHRNLQRKDPR